MTTAQETAALAGVCMVCDRPSSLRHQWGWAGVCFFCLDFIPKRDTRELVAMLASGVWPLDYGRVVEIVEGARERRLAE